MWGLDVGVGGGLAGRWLQYAWPAPGTWAVLINLLTTTASAESAANYRNTPQPSWRGTWRLHGLWQYGRYIKHIMLYGRWFSLTIECYECKLWVAVRAMDNWTSTNKPKQANKAMLINVEETQVDLEWIWRWSWKPLELQSLRAMWRHTRLSPHQ